MSSRDRIHQESLQTLSDLLHTVQPLITKHVEEKVTPEQARYLLQNFSKYLKIDIQADLEKKKSDYSSPFDDLLDDVPND